MNFQFAKMNNLIIKSRVIMILIITKHIENYCVEEIYKITFNEVKRFEAANHTFQNYSKKRRPLDASKNY